MSEEQPHPLVSVAVVTYNQRDFLDECLKSILAQDYAALQIVVADDASSDGTAELIASFAERHPGKFTIRIAERNGGVTVNQNAALAACTGTYISWMAGDDLMLPGKISEQVAYMERNPGCAICYHDLELFDSDSKAILGRMSDFDVQRSGGLATLVRYGHFHGAVSSMVRRSHSPTAIDPTIKVASDWLYYVECLAKGGTINPIPGVFGRYRRHANNVTATTDRSMPIALLQDHLQSCAIILARWPHTASDVRFRMAKLITMQRWQDGGAKYREYLNASLKIRFSVKVAAALLADLLLSVRR